MKNILKTFLFIISFAPLFAQKADTLHATIDLKNVVNDKVKVIITVPPLSFKNAVYVFPMTIPGTYDRQDFIRFIEDVRAYDKNGKSLKIEREKDKQIRIPASQQLHRLEYLVNDSFDDSDTKAYIFPPSGTNIQRDTNFLINHSGFIGYFENTNFPYSITIIKPADFFGATSLLKFATSDTTDILKANTYVTLVDNPVMYSRPDTMSYMQGKTLITIAVNDGESHISAQGLSQVVRPRTEAIEKFLGKMPVDRYTFIFYFQNAATSVSSVHGYGALEHNYSSVYFLPSFKDSVQLDEFVGSVVVHEFLHILVPLNLHSEEIAHFNYRAPQMSQHLWLYEGVTEYFSMLAQVQGGVSSEDDFLNEVSRKISSTESLKKPLSLTTLSKRVLEPEYQELYGNIYEKGAIAAMLLDIRLRELSGGEITLLKLVKKTR
ncbi:MAG TPA: hypothetical protein VEC36_07790 [Patescibacteria group bacterium]|nr:hypothetical protein [Patescibacteria group bacterium]